MVNSAASAQTSGLSPPRDAAPARQLAYSFVTADHNDDKPVTIVQPLLHSFAAQAARAGVITVVLGESSRVSSRILHHEPNYQGS